MKTTVKEFNLLRLMNASPFINKISDETFDALLGWYLNTGADLNTLNIDNDIINGISESTIDEFNKYYNEDDVYVLVKDEENNFISYFN